LTVNSAPSPNVFACRCGVWEPYTYTMWRLPRSSSTSPNGLSIVSLLKQFAARNPSRLQPVEALGGRLDPSELREESAIDLTFLHRLSCAIWD